VEKITTHINIVYIQSGVVYDITSVKQHSQTSHSSYNNTAQRKMKLAGRVIKAKFLQSYCVVLTAWHLHSSVLSDITCLTVRLTNIERWSQRLICRYDLFCCNGRSKYFVSKYSKGKVKVKASPEQATKAQWGVEVYLYSFFNLSARLGGWSTPRPAALPPGKHPVPHCTRGWVGLRAGLDGCGKSCPHRDSIPGPSSP
jgi:hypothetical protein